MYRAILVPLDGSRLAEQAVPPAVELARKHNAQIELVLVDIGIAPSQMVNPHETSDIWRSIRSGPHGYLIEVERRIKAGAPVKVATSIRTSDGRIGRPILEHAREVSADLIVMTTHGHGPLKRMWFGSVADAVIRENEVPTLVIPAMASVTPRVGEDYAFRNVLVPLDGSPAAEEVLYHVTELACRGCEVTLLHVITPQSVPALPQSAIAFPVGWAVEELRALQDRGGDMLERAATGMRDRGFIVHTLVTVEPHAASAILERAASGGTDLIALTTHAAGRGSRLLLGSVADKVVRGSTVPVLVYRPA